MTFNDNLNNPSPSIAITTPHHRPQLTRQFPAATITRKPHPVMSVPASSSAGSANNPSSASLNPSASASSNSCKVVLANSIAKSLLTQVTADIKSLPRAPRLHGFLANKDPAARMYADWTAKTCKEK